MSVENSATTTPLNNRRLDRVLAAHYLDGLRELQLTAVRERRSEAEQGEVDLSYVRRMIQGRIDILRAEIKRREGAGSGSLVEGLAAILAVDPRAPARGLGRHATVEPSRADSHRRYVDSLVADVDLSDVAARTTAELSQAMAILVAEEAGISATRRKVQHVMDAVSAEIARRYRDGEADVDALLIEAPLPDA